MKASSHEWWRGFAAGGASAWLGAATLLALYARGTALIPAAEPLHSQFTADANAIALRIFLVAAAPGVIGMGLLTLWNRSRQD